MFADAPLDSVLLEPQMKSYPMYMLNRTFSHHGNRVLKLIFPPKFIFK